MVYSFGGYETGCKTDFTLEICIWQDEHEEIVELYDSIPLQLDEEGYNTMKKVMWDALGKAIMSI